MSDPEKTPKQTGLEARYEVKRIDGKPLGPAFVMEFDDPNCWEALVTYATTVGRDYPALAEDVRWQVTEARIRMLSEQLNVPIDIARHAYKLGARPFLLGDEW